MARLFIPSSYDFNTCNEYSSTIFSKRCIGLLPAAALRLSAVTIAVHSLDESSFQMQYQEVEIVVRQSGVSSMNGEIFQVPQSSYHPNQNFHLHDRVCLPLICGYADVAVGTPAS
jgi:hypothetical protein